MPWKKILLAVFAAANAVAAVYTDGDLHTACIALSGASAAVLLTVFGVEAKKARS